MQEKRAENSPGISHSGLAPLVLRQTEILRRFELCESVSRGTGVETTPHHISSIARIRGFVGLLAVAPSAVEGSRM